MANFLGDLAANTAEAFEWILLINFERWEELRIRGRANCFHGLSDDLLEALELILGEEITQLLDEHESLGIALFDFLIEFTN